MSNFNYNLISSILLILIFTGCSSKKIITSDNDLLKNIENIKIKYDDELMLDSDKDGVEDKFDLEKNTPKDNKVDRVGRSMDKDYDGVPDFIDDDPFSSLGAFVDKNGREIDIDRDGVPDNMDLNKNTKIGCCVDANGLSTDCLKANFPVIYFNPNSSEVEDFNYDRLQVISSIVRSNLNFKIRIIGYYDYKVLESYNSNLDLKRAESVLLVLSNVFGIEASRMEYEVAKINNDLEEVFLRKVEFELF